MVAVDNSLVGDLLAVDFDSIGLDHSFDNIVGLDHSFDSIDLDHSYCFADIDAAFEDFDSSDSVGNFVDFDDSGLGNSDFDDEGLYFCFDFIVGC